MRTPFYGWRKMTAHLSLRDRLAAIQHPRRYLLSRCPAPSPQQRVGPRSSTPTRAHSSRPMLSAPACLAANNQVSMDGRGRALDNVFCERLWRSVKYENSYLNQYDTVRQLQAGLKRRFRLLQPCETASKPRLSHAARCRTEPFASVSTQTFYPVSWSSDWGQPSCS